MSGPCRWWLFPLLFPLGLTSSPYSAPLSQHCQATPGVARDDRAGAGVKDALWICQRRQWCRRCVLTDGHDATSRGWLGGLTSRLNVLTATPRGALALSLYSGPMRAPGGEAGKRSAPPSPPGALKDECSWAKKQDGGRAGMLAPSAVSHARASASASASAAVGACALETDLDMECTESAAVAIVSTSPSLPPLRIPPRPSIRSACSSTSSSSSSPTPTTL